MRAVLTVALNGTREGRAIARLSAGLDERLAVLREAMAREPLAVRLAAWLEAEGFTPGLAERIITAAGEDKASAWLGDGSGSQALRDAAAGIASLASLGDAGLAIENFRHGHGKRPGHIRRGEVVND